MMTTTKSTMALAELAQKGADVIILREMVQLVAQRLMDLDVGDAVRCRLPRTHDRAAQPSQRLPLAVWDTRAGVRFASDYRNTTAAAVVYNPPLSFYNSVQDSSLDDTAFVWRVHAGADYAPGRRLSMGLKLKWSETGGIEDVSGYEMHGIGQTFTTTNAFGGSRHWTLMLALRRGVGE